MKIGLFQYNPEWENKIKNQEKIIDIFNEQFIKCDLICFPEMTLTGFSMKPERTAEESSEQTTRFFCELANKYDVNIIYGYAQRKNKSYYNTLVVVSNEGKIIETYDKIHLFSFAKEDKIFTPGEKAKTAEICGEKIGLSICYDLRFPELYRIYALEKIKIIVNIANWPDSRIEYWKHLLKARAIENQTYVIGVNRIGKDSANAYSGFSSVYNPIGDKILEVENFEGIFYFEPDFEELEKIRKTFPFLNDIKIISLKK